MEFLVTDLKFKVGDVASRVTIVNISKDTKSRIRSGVTLQYEVVSMATTPGDM
jgi:hypothetical protein